MVTLDETLAARERPRRDAAIIAAAKDGANVAALARKYGISRQRAHQIVRRGGWCGVRSAKKRQ
jgi:Mor family transcriptional regulator